MQVTMYSVKASLLKKNFNGSIINKREPYSNLHIYANKANGTFYCLVISNDHIFALHARCFSLSSHSIKRFNDFFRRLLPTNDIVTSHYEDFSVTVSQKDRMLFFTSLNTIRVGSDQAHIGIQISKDSFDELVLKAKSASALVDKSYILIHKGD